MLLEERVSWAKYARHNVKRIQKYKSTTMCACATHVKETRRIHVRTSVNLTIIINDSSFSNVHCPRMDK